MSATHTSGSEGLLLVGFVVFMVLCTFLCVLTGTDQTDTAVFDTGDRPLRPWQSGVAIGGECMSAVTLLAATGLVALTGNDGMALVLSLVVGLALMALLVAEPLRRAGGRTVSDALARRMPGRSVRVAWGVVTLAVCVPFLVLQLAAVGTMTSFLLGLPGSGPKVACIVVIGVVMVSLAVTGGLRGTAVVQIVKVGMLLVTVTLVAFTVLNRFGWEPGQLLSAAASGSGLAGHYLGPSDVSGGVAGFFDRMGQPVVVAVAIAGLPQVAMRVLSVRGVRATRSAMRWAFVSFLVICALLVVIGLGAAALVGAKALQATDPTGSSSILVLASALDSDGVLLSVVSWAVFLAALATVADVTLAAATSAGHDLYTHVRRQGDVQRRMETPAARWAAGGIGILTVSLAALAADWNLLVLSTVALTLAASALAPVTVYGLLWPRFTKQGALWCLYGAGALTLALITLSPRVSGTPGSVFPDVDFRWTPLLNPGIVTVPAGFLLGWLGSVLDRDDSAPARYEELAHAELVGGRSE
ncbi:cation acetate symporter [Streptomyces sp. bgisy031]|uniref:sodium/solute symporter n=1 Tax=Streptomyces sp. bgisy031 TaxID=3413772 RepID=UPI003D71250D